MFFPKPNLCKRTLAHWCELNEAPSGASWYARHETWCDSSDSAIGSCHNCGPAEVWLCPALHPLLLCERLFFSPKHLKLKIPSNYAAITRAIICGDGIFVMIVVMVIVVAMGIVMIMMFIFLVFQPVEVLCKRWTGWRLSSGDSPCLFVVLDLWMTPCLNWPNRWHWMSQPKTMVRGVHYHRWPQTLSRNGV